MQIWSKILSTLSAGNSCAMISVVETFGSTPREVGARIIVNKEGVFYGSIGGGNMENTSLQEAQSLLQSNSDEIILKEYLLGPELGQCCGGAVKILTEVFTPDHIDEVEIFVRSESEGLFMTTGEIGDYRVQRSIIDGSEQTVGINEGGRLIESFGASNPTVYVFGAGHIGKALMLTLAPLPLDITWIDSRPDIFPQSIPQNFTAITDKEPDNSLAQAPDDAYILILTHDHGIDFDIVHAALKMQRFSYVGVIGSKTKKARFKSRLIQAGLSQGVVDKMICPIGIPSIKSKNPAAIATSVTAELLSHIEI